MLMAFLKTLYFTQFSLQVGPSNEVLPTTHIYAALIILVLGVMLGKFFLWSKKFIIISKRSGNVISAAYKNMIKQTKNREKSETF